MVVCSCYNNFCMGKKQLEIYKKKGRKLDWFSKVKCLCFDLDGTLVDTIEDIGDACNKALEKNNLPTHSYEEYKTFLGHGSKYLITKAIGEENFTDELFNKVFNDYLERYKKFPCVKSRAYKGITNMLMYAYKTRYHLVIITNKPTELAEAIAKKTFPKIQFDLIIGDEDGRKRKPNPDSMEIVKRAFNLVEDEIAYFGDSTVDYEFAKNCNCLKHYFSFYHGFTSKEELEEYGVSKFINNPTEIIEYLHKNGAYKENGRIVLSSFAYIFLFLLFFIDLGVAYDYFDLFLACICAIVFGVVVMICYFLPYAMRKSYLDFRLFLTNFFYFLGMGTILSGLIANLSLGQLDYLISQTWHLYICIGFGSLCLVSAFIALGFFIANRYSISRKEKIADKKKNKIERKINK